MRRKITLYIADQLVDLDDQSLILFNYTMDDLSNPTVVRNSFSQQITLPGTPNNNRLFGDIFRLDRQVYNGSLQGGVSFNPSQKTPFTIYNEMNEVIESGYVKLDSVATMKVPEYKVTLYGGLGSFFYSLSYDEQGNKRSLASLQYLGDSPTELDFTINAQTVRDAWDTVQDGVIDDKWKVLNFVPAYEGIPNGNFSPDKALVVPSDVGLADQVVVGGVTYKVKDGYALVNLAQPQDQWSVKDLRSYLQRPCISMRAIWEAICNPANNGGYTVDKSAIDTDEYADLWVTLPLIPSLGTLKQSTGDLSLQSSSPASVAMPLVVMTSWGQSLQGHPSLQTSASERYSRLLRRLMGNLSLNSMPPNKMVTCSMRNCRSSSPRCLPMPPMTPWLVEVVSRSTGNSVSTPRLTWQVFADSLRLGQRMTSPIPISPGVLGLQSTPLRCSKTRHSR